jgi:hypothetical protein
MAARRRQRRMMARLCALTRRFRLVASLIWGADRLLRGSSDEFRPKRLIVSRSLFSRAPGGPKDRPRSLLSRTRSKSAKSRMRRRVWTGPPVWRYGRTVNRYNLALLLLTLGVVPLFYISGWLSVVAAIAIYSLLARLANNDLDRRCGRGRSRVEVPRRLGSLPDEWVESRH